MSGDTTQAPRFSPESIQVTNGHISSPPLSWDEVVLGDIATYYGGLTGKTKDDFGGDGKPFVPYSNVFANAALDPDSLDRVALGVGETQKRVQYGDILITGSSETLQEAGMSSVVLHDPGELYLNSFCFGVRVTSPGILDPEFAQYLFRSQNVRRGIVHFAQGTTRFNLSKRELMKLRLTLPSIPEQREIARVLGAWNRALADLDALLDAKRERARGLAQRLLAGQARQPEFVQSPEAQPSRIGDLPADWQYVRIGDVAEEVKRRNKRGEDLPVLSCTKYDGLVDSLSYFGKQVFGDDTSSYRVVSRGEFAYATNHIEEGSIGYQDIYPAGLVSPIYTVFKTSERVDDGFLYRLVKSETYRQLFEAWTNSSVDRRGSLRWKDFSLIRIPLPSVKEQRQIAAVLDAAEAEIGALSDQRDALAIQKKGLMQRLLTGEIRVPASSLAD